MDPVACRHRKEVVTRAITGCGSCTQGIRRRDRISGYIAHHLVLAAIILGSTCVGGHDYNIVPRLSRHRATFVDNIDVSVSFRHFERGRIGISPRHTSLSRRLSDVHRLRSLKAVGKMRASGGGRQLQHLIFVDNVCCPDKVVSALCGLRLHCQGNDLILGGLQNWNHTIVGTGNGSQHRQRRCGINGSIRQNGLIILFQLLRLIASDDLVDHMQAQIILRRLNFLQVDDDPHITGGHGKCIGLGRSRRFSHFGRKQQPNGRADNAFDLMGTVHRHLQGHCGGVVDQDALRHIVAVGMGRTDGTGADVVLSLESTRKLGIIV